MDAWEYKQDISLEISVYTIRGGGRYQVESIVAQIKQFSFL